ncbi:hypothetical protein SEA_FUNSIZED_92 [Mycobacterium phage Funsized]|nr:hypothetical protein SEA_FUNSIZED_92 [Mycobacterium phage Funsized]
MPCWLARVVFPVRHPRLALCDHGVWKCDTHPRMMWRAEDRRWAWRHRLRARRVARLTGWAPGELAGHIEAERALLLARLRADFDAVVARHWRTVEFTVPGISATLHTHNPDAVPCRGEASGCRTFPAYDQLITIFPPVMDRIGDLEARR